MADAGEVRDWGDGGGLFDADDEVVGEFAGAAAGSVGDGDEGRGEAFEIADGLIEFLPCGGGAGWEELEGEGGGAGGEDVADVHGGKGGVEIV